MNKLQIHYKDGCPHSISVGAVELNRFELLALASDNSSNEKLAWEVMHLASKLFHWQDDKTFNTLYGAVAMEITHDNLVNEEKMHKWFEDSVSSIFGEEVKVVKKKSNKHHRPDSFVKIDGIDVPVEIKLAGFGKASLQQLQRYMDYYKSPIGVAVAKEKSTDLPDNVIFISVRDYGWKY